MKKRSITVTYNTEGIPYIGIKSDCDLSFHVSPTGHEVEIVGNRKGLLLLARALLGMAKATAVTPTYHIHLDELYALNREGKSFVIRKRE